MKTHFSIWSHLGSVYEDLEAWNEKQTPISGPMCQNHDRVASKLPPRSSAANPPDPPDPPQMDSGLAEQTLGTPRWGAG